MSRRLAAPRAELLQLETVRRRAAVLASDVVTLLAVLARKGNLWADIRRFRSHCVLLWSARSGCPVNF